MKESLKLFAGDLRKSLKDLLPIIIVVALLQGAAIQAMPENLTSIVIGLGIVAVGLALFILPHLWCQTVRLRQTVLLKWSRSPSSSG